MNERLLDDIEDENDASQDILDTKFNLRALKKVEDDLEEVCSEDAELKKLMQVHKNA